MLKKKSHFHYTISTQNPHLHFFEVELKVSFPKQKIVLTMPSWAPGSYLIRDFIGHIHQFEITSSQKQKISWKQSGLSSWEILSNGHPFSIHYKVYAYEYTVRTNFLDSEFGFISPPAFFLYPENFLSENVEIEFKQNDHFKYYYSSLKKKTDSIFIASNFDELFDSPFQISNRPSLEYTIEKCKHEVIIEGAIKDFLKNKIIDDLKKLTSYIISMFEDNPNLYYLYIINLTTSNAYGGLEHTASSVNYHEPEKLYKPSEYNKLLGLLAHEYFHLYDGKRIRPVALGPFNYNVPNLTKDLWIVEGITSFYDNYTLYKTGFLSKEDYLSELLTDYNKLTVSNGEEWMSLEDSSFTTWTKFYRQQANSHNTNVSYYLKGSIVTLCMDIFIREKSNCKKKFSDVMRILYKKYKEKPEKGITKSDFYQLAKKATEIDLMDEFDEAITSPTKIDVLYYLKKIGVVAEYPNPINSKAELSFDVKKEDGKLIINKIYQHRNIKNSDINLYDELIAINGWRVTPENINHSIEALAPNTEIELLLSRRNLLIQRKLITEQNIQATKFIIKSSLNELESKMMNDFFKQMV